MKKFRKALKLLLPGAVMHRRLERKFHLKVENPANSAFGRFWVNVLPYAVSAIMQQKVETDRRPGKYFMPYGLMRKHVKDVYGMQVGNEKRDTGLSGFCRFLLPYGLVLWWDREDERIDGEIAARGSRVKSRVQTPAAESSAFKAEIERLRREAELRHDAQDIQLLRLRLGARRPSVTVIVTGYADADGYRSALKELLAASLYELEALIALPFEDDETTVALADMQAVDSRITVIDGRGLTLTAARAKALAQAKGDYVSFLDVTDRYSSRHALELLLLSTAAESANLGGGKQAVRNADKINYPEGILWNRNGLMPSLCAPIAEGLAAFVFSRAWLQAQALPFLSATGSDDTLFLQATEVLAGDFLAYGRSVSVRGQDSIALAHTYSEKIAGGRQALATLVAYRPVVPSAAFDRFQSELRDLLDRYGRPLVSVIVPAYNVEKYLVRCLDSLVGQTLTDVEIIVVDDGSTDGTPGIADAYAASHDQVKVIHKQNGGLSSARNAGMAIATGKYVGFVDGDDWVEPDMYESMAQALEEDEKSDFAMCSAKVDFNYSVTDEEAKWAQRYFDFSWKGGVNITPEVVEGLNVSACIKLCRSAMLKTFNIRFPEGIKNEDIVFTFFLLGKCARIQFVQKQFYHYIRNNRGIMAVQKKALQKNGVLPDSLRVSLPLVMSYILADDRRDLLGSFYRCLCGAYNANISENGARRVSQLLHASNYYYFREFIASQDMMYIRGVLDKLHNYDYSDLPAIKVDNTMLPVLRRKYENRARPLVSFVVPVCNQEKYLSYCLESIRKQIDGNIEIICVDDGSEDDSRIVLSAYAAIDERIRVFHQVNRGVSAARNFAIKQARGRYIAFVDSDDYIKDSFVSDIVRHMMRFNLDMCLIDYQCFAFNDRHEIDHYWRLQSQIGVFPKKTVFTFDEISAFRNASAPWVAVWRRDFLIENELEFPALKNGEDFCFWLKAYPLAKRIGMVNKVLYYYRRGNSASAMSCMGGDEGSARAVQYVRQLVKQWCDMFLTLSQQSRKLLANRIMIELKYYSKFDDALIYLQTEGLDKMRLDTYCADACCKLRLMMPSGKKSAPGVSAWYMMALRPRELDVLNRIERARLSSKKDLIIVTGQLNSVANEPIDSWTFFQWLQDHHVPSRYVLWKKHFFYKQLKREGRLKDVIGLHGDGCSNLEFVKRCENDLIRCQAVIQENGALNSAVRNWLYHLKGCEYVFMQHGLTFTTRSLQMAKYFLTFNAINVASEREKNFIGEYLSRVDPANGTNFIIAGLPRWDLLVANEARHEKVVFIMLTWRASFSKGMARIRDSAYYHALEGLLSKKNVAALRSLGYRIVLAPHHHLVNTVPDLDFGVGVDVVSAESISTWIRRASICVTDFSSVSGDFMFQNKPTIFWIPDRYDLLLDQSTHDDGGKVLSASINLKSVHNLAKSPEEVMNMLKYYSKHNFGLEPEKLACAETFFAYRKNICQHLYEGIKARS